MAFIKIPGLAGKVYVPDPKPASIRKHDCKDCFSCQSCGDSRCRLCRGPRRDVCPKSPDRK